MQTFKLTPRPQSDYRVEVKEIKRMCTVERQGYRHNKIIYGFSDDLPDATVFESLSLNIEEIAFDDAQLKLADNLVERARIKSNCDRLQRVREKKGSEITEEEVRVQKQLTDLNNNIQSLKEKLGIAGLLKAVKF